MVIFPPQKGPVPDVRVAPFFTSSPLAPPHAPFSQILLLLKLPTPPTRDRHRPRLSRRAGSVLPRRRSLDLLSDLVTARVLVSTVDLDTVRALAAVRPRDRVVLRVATGEDGSSVAAVRERRVGRGGRTVRAGSLLIR